MVDRAHVVDRRVVEQVGHRDPAVLLLAAAQLGARVVADRPHGVGGEWGEVVEQVVEAAAVGAGVGVAARGQHDGAQVVVGHDRGHHPSSSGGWTTTWKGCSPAYRTLDTRAVRRSARARASTCSVPSGRPR